MGNPGFVVGHGLAGDEELFRQLVLGHIAFAPQVADVLSDVTHGITSTPMVAKTGAKVTQRTFAPGV